MVTPRINQEYTVPRTHVKCGDVSSAGFIKIHYYREDNRDLANLMYKDIAVVSAEDPTSNLDVLWQTSLLFSTSRSAWAGMMQCVHCNSYPGRSSVLFLPMIDMRSNYLSFIYSTLNYISNHAYRHNIIPIVTFDQPLWWKALSIILSQPEGSPIQSVVLRLGAFLMEMSYLGSIGHLMSGSGVK